MSHSDSDFLSVSKRRTSSILLMLDSFEGHRHTLPTLRTSRSA